MTAWSPAARIDEVDIAQDLRGRNHHVPVDNGANVPYLARVFPRVSLDRPETAVTERTRRVEFAPANALHVVPIVERAIRVYETDDALLGLDFNRHWQRRQALTDASLLGIRNLIQPSTTVHPVVDLRVGVAKRSAPDQKIMVPANGVKPWPIKPGQHPIGFRATIDKIADREQSIDALVEPDHLESFTQRGEAPVNVTNRKISAGEVARKSAHAAVSGRASCLSWRPIINTYCAHQFTPPDTLRFCLR